MTTVAVSSWRTLLPVFAACAAIGLQAGTAMPLVPLALERMGHDKLTIGIVAAAWGVGMLATASHIPRLAARWGAVPFIVGAVVAGSAITVAYTLTDSVAIWFILTLLHGVDGRRALGGERDLDERGRRGEAPRPGHGGLFHAGGARPGAGAVRAADRRRLRTQAVHHLRRPGAAGGAAAAALLEDRAEDRACRGQRLPAGRRPGAACHAGGLRLRAGRAGRLQLPAGLCRRRRRVGRDRRALALDLRDRQRGPAMADRLDGRSFRPAPGAGGLCAREHPAGRAAVGRVGAVADGHRRDRAVGRAVVCDLSRRPGAARPAHRRRRHRARQHRLQHALHPGRPGRPAARGCGDGCGRRSRARLDARGLLFDRRRFAPCWHSTDAADKAAAA